MVSEQRKTKERNFRFCPLEKWYENPIFRAIFDSCSSFFARKPHGNACYAGLATIYQRLSWEGSLKKRLCTQLKIEPARCERSENSANASLLNLYFRVVSPDSTKEINGYVFTGWGAHAQHYRCAYLTAAAAIGMTKADVDTFLKRLDKCLSKFSAKEVTVSGSIESGDQDEQEPRDGNENGLQKIADNEATDNSTVNR